MTKIALLSAVQNFFEYTLYTCCGIPRITLEGTVEDWQRLRQKFSSWTQFGLNGWIETVDPILEQFELAARGQVNRTFWDNIYRNGGGDESGGQAVLDGWLQWFFPYVDQGTTRHWGGDLSIYFEARPKAHLENAILQHSALPSSLSSMPFCWNVDAQPRPMELLAGLVGVEQNRNSLALKPAFGWVVRDPSQLRPEDADDFETLITDHSDLMDDCRYQAPDGHHRSASQLSKC